MKLCTILRDPVHLEELSELAKVLGFEMEEGSLRTHLTFGKLDQ